MNPSVGAYPDLDPSEWVSAHLEPALHAKAVRHFFIRKQTGFTMTYL